MSADGGNGTGAGDPRRPRLVGGIARLLLGVFFRDVEVRGEERVPRGRPLIFVGNHVNSLLDPALLIGYLPIAPRFLAKSTLWRQPLVRFFLELAAAIPVYRKQDEGVDTRKNAETFAACHEVLRGRGALAIFPEGISHDEPALVPLKTGVSRILLEAETKYGGEVGLGTCIVPVGLTFDDKTRFRSRALVQVGPPIEPAAEIALYREQPDVAVRALTERVRDGLEDVTINYPSWPEARLIKRAVEIYSRPVDHGPGEHRLGKTLVVEQLFVEGYQQLLATHPAEVHEVAAAVRDYDEELRELELEDAQVASLYPMEVVFGYLLRSLGKMLLLAPLGLAGIALNLLPYHLAGWLADRLAPSPDTVATYKLFASLLAYPFFWALEGAALGWRFGWQAGLAATLAGPLCGFFAVRLYQAFDHLARQSRAYLLLRSGRFSVEKLKVKRRRVFAALSELVELVQELHLTPLPPSARGREEGGEPK